MQRTLIFDFYISSLQIEGCRPIWHYLRGAYIKTIILVLNIVVKTHVLTCNMAAAFYPISFLVMVPIEDIMELDYRLVAPPAFNQGYLDTYHKVSYN